MTEQRSEDVSVIVKVQIPLETTEDVPHMLVYSEDRETVHVFTPVQERFAKELRRTYKGYYMARINGDAVDIGERVADQEW